MEIESKQPFDPAQGRPHTSSLRGKQILERQKEIYPVRKSVLYECPECHLKYKEKEWAEKSKISNPKPPLISKPLNNPFYTEHFSINDKENYNIPTFSRM